jgi:MFS family permease
MTTANRTAGVNQGLILIALASLPTLAIVSLVPNLPQLFQQFASAPNHELLVPMIITVPSLCIALFSPIAGTIADFWGRRRLLLIALVAYGTVGLLPLMLDGLLAIIASRFVVGIAEAAILTTGNALLGDYFAGEQRKKWLGIQSTVGPIVALVLVLAGGKLGSMNWRGPFVLYALGLLVFVWVLLGTWEPEGTKNRDAKNASTAQAAGPPGVASGAGRFPWGSAILVGTVTIGIAILYFVQAIQLGRIFGDLGAGSPARISVVVSIASLGVIFGGFFYRKIAQRPIGQVFSLIFLALAIGYVGLAWAPDYKVGLPFAMVAQFANGLTIPALITWALSKYDFVHRGRGMGLWGSCFFISSFVSPPAMTLVGSFSGGFLSAVSVVGILCFVLAVLTFLMPGNKPAPVSASTAAD